MSKKVQKKWRFLRRTDRDFCLKIADGMKEKGQTFLQVDAEKLMDKNLSCLKLFDHITGLSLHGFNQSQIKKAVFPKKITDLYLLSVRVQDYSFLLPLKNLEILDIRLGGSKDFSALGNLTNLKSLSLLKILSLHDLSFISKLHRLQFLKVDSCKKISTIPNLIDLRCLRRVHLERMRGLTDISGIANAPKIEDLIIMESESLLPENLECFIGHPTIKRILPGIGTLPSAKYKQANAMFPQCAISGFYGTDHHKFELI